MSPAANFHDGAEADLPGWLGDHHEFLAFLRRNEFEIGLDREIRFARLLRELRRGGIAPGDPAAAARWFGPVICSTARDQARFAALIQAYVERSTTAPVLDAGGVLRTGREAPADDKHSAPKRPFRRYAGRVGRLLLPLVPVLLLVAAAAFWLPGVRTPKAPTGDGPTPAPIVGPRVAIQPAVTAPVHTMTWRSYLPRLAVALIPITVALLLVPARRKRQIGLTRKLVLDEVTGNYLDLGIQTDPPFSLDQMRRVTRLLGGYRRMPSTALHIAATVRATIRAGGRVHLRYRERPALPNYLLVVERTSSFDHIGVLGDLITARLVSDDIQIARFDFDQDMRTVRRANTTHFEKLRDLAARSPSQRLIVVSDGASLLGPDKHVRPWLQTVLEGFSAAALVSPAPKAVWGTREAELAAAGFQVVSATVEGLADAAIGFDHIDGTVSPLIPRPHEGHYADLAGQLQYERDHWVSDRPPEPNEQKDLVVSLRAWLGEDGFMLLAALALFPEIRGEMTLSVAEVLGRSDPGRPSIDDTTLAEIMRLPWLRQGRMPDWARAALLRELPPASAARVRSAYDFILRRANISKSPRGAMIVRVPRLRGAIATAVRSASKPSRRERIAWSFWRGRELELALPRVLARQLHKQFDASEWFILAIGAVTAVLVALLLDVDRLGWVPTLPTEPAATTIPPPRTPVAPVSPPPLAAAPPSADIAPAPRSYLIFFEWRDASLTPRAAAIAKEAAEAVIRSNATRVEVNGYDDTSGTPRAAMDLSIRRAQAVASELIKDGVPANILDVRGFGDTHLMVATPNGVREPQNRRVEIVIPSDAEARPAPPIASAPGPVVTPPAPSTPTSWLVFFNWGAANLTDSARQIVDLAATTALPLLTTGKATSMRVEGNDDTSTTARQAQDISLRRARAVADALIKDGIPRDKIVARGFGTTRLIVPTGPGIREPENRNVLITLQMAGQTEPPAAASDPAQNQAQVRTTPNQQAGAPAANQSVTLGTEQDFIANVGDRVFFNFDSLALGPEAQATLNLQVAWLKRNPDAAVQIAGHSDDLEGGKNGLEFGLALGSRRAQAVAGYLEKNGIAASRISTISYGSQRPIAAGANEAARAQNRVAIMAIK